MTNLSVILQVEDREEDVYLLQRAFKRAGIVVNLQVAADGREAIQYLSGADKFADRQKYPFPYLILLDLKLPQLTGLDVLAWMRDRAMCTVVVIVLSSSIHDSDVKRAYELGAKGFLVKPSNLETLTDMCQALNHFWLIYNQPPTMQTRGETRSGPSV